MDVEPAVVERQSGTDRVLIDGGMAAGVAALNNKALAAMIPQGFGAGVGRVGPYYEQGNWYRGGAVQMLFIAWLYGEQNQVRPMFPREYLAGGFDSRVEIVRPGAATAARGLGEGACASAGERHYQSGGWSAWHFCGPRRGVDGRRDDQARSRTIRPGIAGGLWDDSKPINVPGFWFMSWYDVSVGPNLAAYNYVRRTARPEIANEQYAVIAPTLHCSYKRATEDTIVGERSMGDARLDYDALTYGWFDYFLKGEKNRLSGEDAEGPLLHDGAE